MPVLQIVTVSTRPGRKGPAVAAWAAERARAHGRFEVEPVDLAEVGLPLFDEPEHPRRRDYRHDHTKRWSARVDRADAFVFVTPEYNFGVPPALLNALDYLSAEWAFKPAAFVSYGGQSGGLRSVEMAKPRLTALEVMPVPQGVALPFFGRQLDADGRFVGDEHQERAAAAMLDALARWEGALRPLRRG